MPLVQCVLNCPKYDKQCYVIIAAQWKYLKANSYIRIKTCVDLLIKKISLFHFRQIKFIRFLKCRDIMSLCVALFIAYRLL